MALVSLAKNGLPDKKKFIGLPLLAPARGAFILHPLAFA